METVEMVAVAVHIIDTDDSLLCVGKHTVIMHTSDWGELTKVMVWLVVAEEVTISVVVEDSV